MFLFDFVAPMDVKEAKRSQYSRSKETCQTGYHKQGTKPSPTHKGVTVNNCVPNESQLNELAAGYAANKGYSELGAYKRYNTFVSKKKFNNIAFIAVAENPRTNEVKFKANAPTQQEAVQKLHAEIDKEIEVATKVSGAATIDFNVDFVRDVLEMSSNTFYAKIVPGPKLVIAGKEMEQYPDIMKQEGFKASSIRTVTDSEGATKLPAMPLSASGAVTAQLIANGRYVLGAETIDKDGNRIFDLEFDSQVADPRERIRMGAPAITIGTKRETKEDAWHAGDNAWSSENHEMVEGFGNSPVAGAIVNRIMRQRVDLLKQYGPELVGAAVDNVADYVGDVEEIGSSDVSAWVAQVERMLKENPPEAFDEGTGPQSKLDQKIIHLLTNGIPAEAIARKLDIPVEWVHEVAEYNMPDSSIDYNDPRNVPPENRFGEGFQDFNKVEPYEVCLAGKPVKTFDYYEDARRFHDNWKKKLYREGNQAKADRITLNPIMKEAISKKDLLGKLQKDLPKVTDPENKGDPNAWARGDSYTGARDQEDIDQMSRRDTSEPRPTAAQRAKDLRVRNKRNGVAEAETDYSKRRAREKDIDAGKPVAKQRQPKMTDYQKRRAQQKKEMELGEGTNYWTKLQNERSTKLNSLVNELKESINK